jgi:hypothetical protein
MFGHEAPGPVPRCFVLPLLLAIALSPGCSGSQATPVDAERAREALKTTLDGWKKGETPEALNKSMPAITAQDLDWLSGSKLVDYTVTGDGKSMEANLYVPVTLTMKTSKGKEVKKKVTYVVGTSPHLTVFRALP